MQVHHQPRAAPALALAFKISIKEVMQIHAPNACQAINP